MSVLVDQSRQPVALLQSDGRAISIRPVIGKLPSRGSLTKLFDDPYGYLVLLKIKFYWYTTTKLFFFSYSYMRYNVAFCRVIIFISVYCFIS